MRFSKYHALGNDYLVLEPAASPQPPRPREIQLICHRNYGLGSDGILYGPLEQKGADFGLRIFNPDGSEAGKSGNGLRIFAKYLFETGRVQEKPFQVHTPGGNVRCGVSEGGSRITVGMGHVSFRSEDIPVDGRPREVLREKLEVAGETVTFTGATIGNPHCVIPLKTISPELARRLGPLIETDPLFPHRTNVQFMRKVDDSTIAIEIWERGAGYTLASGSSSSACAAVAVKLGLVSGPEVTVVMPGGALAIRVDEDFGITMTGPATRVGDYQMDAGVTRQDVPL